MGDSGSQTSGSSSGSELSVHVGVGCGRVSCFHVGSDERGWQLVVSGELFGEQVSLVRSMDVLGDPPRPLSFGSALVALDERVAVRPVRFVKSV